MQQDTLFGEMERPLTQNLYIYCLNNGVNLRDPSGNSSIAELQAQYDRAQRAGAGQSVLDEIKKAIESKRKADSKPTPKPTTKPPKKPDWGDTSNPYNPVNNPNSVGSILSGADGYWGSGGGSSGGGSSSGSGNPSDIPHGGISGKFDETATKKIASSKYGDYFDDKIKVASPVMGLGVAVTQFDTPLLGPADAVGGLIILGALGTASTIALIDYLTGKPIIFDKDKAPASPGKLQGEVKKGQAPRDVERVDPGHPPNFPGAKPHVHFGDGTAQNVDGTVHDKDRGTPNPSNKTKDWLEKNGWKVK